MSTVRVVWIRCDGCGAYHVGINHDFRATLAAAHRVGWTSVKGVPRKDYCSTCSMRSAAPAEEGDDA